MAFDAKLAASILLPFDGDSEKLSSFKDSFIHVPLGTRYTPEPEYSSDAGLELNATEEKYTQVELSSGSWEDWLKAIKKGTARQQYCEEIESLCSQLSRTYVKEGIPQVTAKKIATKAGVETLIKTVSTENAKIVLQAGSFPTIEQAIQKLNELPDNAESNDVNRIFNINANQKRYQNFNQGQRGNWKRGVNSNNNNFARRGPHANYQRFNNAARFDNRPHNGNYRGRSYYRGHPPQGRQSHRIYFADAQNDAPAANAIYSQQPYVNDEGHSNWNMNPQPQQNSTNQPQNQNFLGTLGQYTQSM
ncbi:uncharacterized protein LOC134219748 [Armigeres subalbatus]|uniref:uncharacterized protein LOC134219748 n=1 Tax=Armigeres subalbatus TaxID=124917 RepID=UPI002ED61912